jgi:quercetin dioxygenase-like cupin family protein
MKQKTNAGILLALLMAFASVACKDAKKEEPAKTDAAKTEVAPMPGFDPAMDATKTPGYPATILADTLNLKAYEFLVNPGDTVPMHSHPDHLIYVLEGGTAEIKGTDGKVQVTEFKKGACMISGPQSHSAKNTGATAIKLLIVHCYRPRS